MISMAFYGYIIYLIYKYVKKQIHKMDFYSIIKYLICSIGISRIYLGVHYTSDVLGGFLISVSYLVIYISAVIKSFVLWNNCEQKWGDKENYDICLDCSIGKWEGSKYYLMDYTNVKK